MIFATYNVHRCIGLDGRQDVERVAAVIRELDADVVGLQEVGSGPSWPSPDDQASRLAALAGYHAVGGPLHRRPDASYGNALLAHEPAQSVRLIDLSVTRREPRGAIVADVLVSGRPIRTVVTHLGLRGRERRRQLQNLLEAVGSDVPPTVMLADLNEWFGPARMLRLVHQFGGRAVRSFPASWPVLALDRVLVRPASLLIRVTAHHSRLARVASDHLPVRAELRDPG